MNTLYNRGRDIERGYPPPTCLNFYNHPVNYDWSIQISGY